MKETYLFHIQKKYISHKQHATEEHFLIYLFIYKKIGTNNKFNNMFDHIFSTYYGLRDTHDQLATPVEEQM